MVAGQRELHRPERRHACRSAPPWPGTSCCRRSGLLPSRSQPGCSREPSPCAGVWAASWAIDPEVSTRIRKRGLTVWAAAGAVSRQQHELEGRRWPPTGGSGSTSIPWVRVHDSPTISSSWNAGAACWLWDPAQRTVGIDGGQTGHDGARFAGRWLVTSAGIFHSQRHAYVDVGARLPAGRQPGRRIRPAGARPDRAAAGSPARAASAQPAAGPPPPSHHRPSTPRRRRATRRRPSRATRSSPRRVTRRRPSTRPAIRRRATAPTPLRPRPTTPCRPRPRSASGATA